MNPTLKTIGIPGGLRPHCYSRAASGVPQTIAKQVRQHLIVQ